MKWFGNTWEGSEHTFPGNGRHPPTTWIMHSKMSEKSRQSEEALATMYDDPCTAWATYLCQPKDHPGKMKYVMKVYMQIPWEGSEMDYSESRVRQARNDLPVSARNELQALSELKECRSTGTPILVDSFQDKQSANMCVPGGFLLFLLMTHCPGVPVPDFRTRPLEEREDIRQAFRVAYEECLRCNVLNSEHGCENLLWDAENKKCYIVDFKSLGRARSGTEWGVHVLKWWMLQERRKT